MIKSNFDLAFGYLIQNEGTVFTNDPVDSGGATKYGVTKKEYETFVGHGVPVSDIQNLTEDIAKQFYFKQFWTPLHCESFAQPAVAVAIFDTAVLYGPWFASRLAQVVANHYGANLKLDGILGDKSRAAINSVSVSNFLKDFHVLILDRINRVIENNPKNEKYRKGWTSRAGRLLNLVHVIPKE